MQHRISEIQIIPIKARDGLVGFASLVFDDCLYLGSIGIFTRPQGGYRLTYPTRSNGETALHVFHPINKTVAEHIEKNVIEKYEQIINTGA